MKSLLLCALGIALSGAVSAKDAHFEHYVKALKQQAREQGISELLVNQAFRHIHYRPRAVVADNNQPEQKLMLDEYLSRAVPEWKVRQARALYKQHYDELVQIGQQYGVQPRFIVALWGIESNFGAFTGHYPVVDALTTLAFDSHREAFFRQELMSALRIVDQGHIRLDEMKGSWAGAMGQCQFMPSAFLTFAADGNGDGRKDIWMTRADVFASTANYLHQSGWDDAYSWGRAVKVPKNFDMTLQGRQAEKGKPLRQWEELGLTRANGSPLPQLNENIKAWLVQPDDASEQVYLVYNNYNVLMKWNRSHYFALAVSALTDRIVS